jgi:hypothetical protein
MNDLVALEKIAQWEKLKTLEPKARPTQESLRTLTPASVGEAFEASSPPGSAARECPSFAGTGHFKGYWLADC